MASKRSAFIKPSVSKTKRRRKMLTVQEKVRLLDMFKDGKRIVEVARHYGLNESTVRSIRKHEKNIRASATASLNKESKRVVTSRNKFIVKTESALVEWIRDNREKDIPLDSMVIREKARQLYRSFTADEPAPGSSSGCCLDFVASKGWFGKFQRRYHLKGVVLHERAESDDQPSAEDCVYNTFHDIIDGGGDTPKQPTHLPETYDLRLVTEVEKIPMLYDPNDPDYINKDLSNGKWNEIGELLGITAERARARWTTLTACYNMSLTMSHNFYLSEPMSFLQPHLNIDRPPSQEASVDKQIINIKSEPEFEDESFPGDISGENLVVPVNKTCSRAAESTTADAAEDSEDLEMKVEEIHEYPSTTTSNPYLVSLQSPPTSSQQQMPEIKRDRTNPGQNLPMKRGSNPTASVVEEHSRGDNSMSSSEDQTLDSNMEYFKGFSSLIKQLSAKRKRQLFGTFAAELFRHLDEQEND